MPENIPLLIVSNNETFIKEANAQLGKLTSLNLTPRGCAFSEALIQIGKWGPALVLLDLINPVDSIVTLIETITRSHKAPKLIGVGEPPGVSILMRFIKMGMKDFLNLPFQQEEISEILKKFRSDQDDSHDHEVKNRKNAKEAKIITLFSPKGGTGVTLLTASLSVVLAKNHNQQAVVCDLAPQCGDVATYLNLTPQYNIRDIIENHKPLDISFLEGCMISHSSGVKILSAPREGQDALTADHLNTLKSIFSILKESYDVLLIDSSHLDPALLQFALASSDLIFLVGNPDVVSLKGLIVFFNKLQALHYDTEKIKVLINRYNSKSQIDTKEFEKITRHPVACYLPNNFMLCIEAVNTGQPITSIQDKSDLAKQIGDLASLIMNLSPNESSQNRGPSGTKKKGILRCF